MTCHSCGKTMKKTGDNSWKCPCGVHVGLDLAKRPLMDKPIDAHNQVRNITDEVDPDLHRKPSK